MEYYFDIETTGLNPQESKIITLQYQALSESGTPSSKLVIMKEWENNYSEKVILESIRKMLIDNIWNFIPVGNNLPFDFWFISVRMEKYFGINVLSQLMNRPWLDIKHVLVIMNRGSSKNYGKIMGKVRFGGSVPLWYERGEYNKIIGYIEREAEAFVSIYRTLKQKLPSLS